MRLCTVLISVPDSSRCVANESRKVWDVIRFGMPALRTASRIWRAEGIEIRLGAFRRLVAPGLGPCLRPADAVIAGRTISLVYFLPAFARERLYTFPLPPKAGETVKDCHWSALNFLNEKVDDKLLDNAYASKYVQDHFYPIGQPSQCGDLIFLIGANGEVIHSAVHIAGDIAFTKNGANYAQPWILMRMDKLLKVYSSGTNTPKALYYRRNRS